MGQAILVPQPINTPPSAGFSIGCGGEVAIISLATVQRGMPSSDSEISRAACCGSAKIRCQTAMQDLFARGLPSASSAALSGQGEPGFERSERVQRRR